jgi:hypothetical protein
MDKKLLEALNNLSFALEEIADALKSKKGNKSATTEAMQSGNFSKDINRINIGIQSIKKDTQEILKQQKTILAISQKKEDDKKTGLFEKAGGDKKSESSLKKGVGTIMLIALAVLAIGLAFKLVGKVDFVSVIGLSIALLIISAAFEKIGQMKLTLKQVAITSFAIVLLSVAITMSSWILRLITPIGFLQAITGILISAMFLVISANFGKIASGVADFEKYGVKPKDLLLVLLSISAAITLSSWILRLITPIGFAQAITGILIAAMFVVMSVNFHRLAVGVTLFAKMNVKPKDLILTLTAISAAITLSSWILNLITPLSIGQAITGILIAVMFFVISFNMEKIAAGVVAFEKTKVKPKDLLLVLVGIAAAITVSSWVLSLIMPISFANFITALGIAVLFALMSYVMPQLAIGVVAIAKGVGTTKVWMIPLVLVTISLAIMASSYILSMTKTMDYGFLLKVLVFGVVLAVVTLAMMPSVLAVGIAAASGVGAGAIVLGAVMIPIIAAAIVASSIILALGNYSKYPKLGWSIGVGLTLLAFTTAAIALGILAITGIGAIAIVAGAAMVLVVAATIVATAEIIGKGDYSKYPDWKWVLSVGASMTAFGLATIALGALAVTGIGAIAIWAGAKLIPVIAQTIVDTAEIVGKGNYSKYPSLGWVVGVGLLMTTFVLAVVTLGSFIVGSLGLGYIALEAGAAAVDIIANSIVSAASILNGGNFTGGPKKEWAEGVSLAIGAFAPVYGMLMADGIMKIFGGGGVGPTQFSDAIITVSKGIVDAANFFSTAGGSFQGGPKKEWAEGVGLAIGAFAPVYSILSSEKGLFGSGVSINDFVNAIHTISHGIIGSATIFAGSKVGFDKGTYPSQEWGQGVGAALTAFAPVFQGISEAGFFESADDVIKGMVKGVISISSAIVSIAGLFTNSKVNWDVYPSSTWVDNVGKSVKSYIAISKSIGDSEYDSDDDESIKVAVKFLTFAKIVQSGAGAFNTTIDPNFMKNISSNLFVYMAVSRRLSEGNDLKSLVKGAKFDDPMSNIASGMLKLAFAYEKMANAITKFGTSLNTLDEKKLQMFKGISNTVSSVTSVKLKEDPLAGVNVKKVSEQSIPVVSKSKLAKTVTGVNEKGEVKGKNGTMSEQLDKMVELLAALSNSTKSLDAYLKDQMSKNDDKKSIFDL